MGRRARNILLGIPFIIGTLVIACVLTMLGIEESKLDNFMIRLLIPISYSFIVLMPMYVWYDLHSKLNSPKRWTIFISINLYFLLCGILVLLDSDIIEAIKDGSIFLN